MLLLEEDTIKLASRQYLVELANNALENTEPKMILS